jgi:hypothetical protein
MELGVVVPIRLRSCVVLLVVGLALTLPTFCRWCSGRRPDGSPVAAVWGAGTAGASAPRTFGRAGPTRAPRVEGAAGLVREVPVCLEAWVYLRSYGGGPLLVAVQGYRLEIFRRAGGWSNGHLVFAGPLEGRAWISDRPLPLGRWVHVAGVSVPRPPPARRLVLNVSAPPPARLAIDGADATVPGWGVGDLTLPLGVDPLEDQAADCRRFAFAACRDLAAPPDGQVGAWRLTFYARSLQQIAAGRGQPWRLGPLPPSLTETAFATVGVP